MWGWMSAILLTSTCERESRWEGRTLGADNLAAVVALSPNPEVFFRLKNLDPSRKSCYKVSSKTARSQSTFKRRRTSQDAIAAARKTWAGGPSTKGAVRRSQII